MAVIKILITGDTNTGKTTLANYLLTLDRYKDFNYVSIDQFRDADTDIHQEYTAKINFAQKATEPSNTIIECSGVGITASLLLSALRDLIETTPVIVIPFFLQPKDKELSKSQIDPRHALINFREFNPVTITHTLLKDRLRVINRIFRKSI